MIVAGYGVNSAQADFYKYDIPRRELNADDVSIRITYTGVCHSDWHHIFNDWKNSKYPMIPGHEIVGIVEAIGSNVVRFRIGQQVAVGTIVNSCFRCVNCARSQEQYCINDATETYNGHERLSTDKTTPTGPITMGGFSEYIVVKEHFVFDVSMFKEQYRVAPLLCAGITMYAPLCQFKTGLGHKVGIAGIGGLGHMGVKLAAARGAEVIALTRTPWKADDAIKLGAIDSVIMTDKADRDRYEGKLDLILCTIPVKHDLEPYFKLMKTGGVMYILGALEPLDIHGGTISWNNLQVRGSQVGGVTETQQMIDFCHFHNILPDVELISMSELPNTYQDLQQSKVKYRFVVNTPTLYDI